MAGNPGQRHSPSGGTPPTCTGFKDGRNQEDGRPRTSPLLYDTGPTRPLDSVDTTVRPARTRRPRRETHGREARAWVRSLRTDAGAFATSPAPRQTGGTSPSGSACPRWTGRRGRADIASSTLAADPVRRRTVRRAADRCQGHRGRRPVACWPASTVSDRGSRDDAGGAETAREFVELGVRCPEVWATCGRPTAAVDRLTARAGIWSGAEQATELQQHVPPAFECVDALRRGLGAAYARGERPLAGHRRRGAGGFVNAAADAVQTSTPRPSSCARAAAPPPCRIVVWHEDTARLQKPRWVLGGQGAQQTLLIPRGQSLLYAGATAQPFPARRPSSTATSGRAAPSYERAGLFRAPTTRPGRPPGRSGHAGSCRHRRAVLGRQPLAALSRTASRLRRFVSDELASSPRRPNTRELRRTLPSTSNPQRQGHRTARRRPNTGRLPPATRRAAARPGPRRALLELWVALVLVDAWELSGQR